MVKADAPDSYLGPIQAMLTATLGPREGRLSDEALDKYADFEDGGRIDRYKLADKYYYGRQESHLTDRLQQYLETESGVTYIENICQVVSDAFAERFVVVGVTTDHDEPAPPPPPPAPPPVPGEPPQAPPEKAEKPPDLADWLWNRVWDGSQGDQRQIEVHNDMARRGDAFTIVDYDTERLRPSIVRQLPNQIRIIYENGVKSMAIKKWYTSASSPTNPAGRKICRMNLYYDDRIEKWFKLADGKGWVEWLDDGDDVWPTPWVAKDEKPLGIPVFHVPNSPDDSGYGRAEHRIIIPIQDRLTKELIDLSSILDQEGWPQRWASGLASADSLKGEPGTVWSTENENAQFGQFDAASPSGALSSIDSTIARASKLSRTPEYMLNLSGGTPSGEALKTSESGLVSKVQGRHPFVGNQWTEMFRMSILVALSYGGTTKEEQPPVSLVDARGVSININWKDPRTFDEQAHLAALQIMKDLGIPEEYLWSRIEGVDVEAVKALKRTSDVQNAARLVADFNRGGDTNPAEPGQGVPAPPGAGSPPPRPPLS